jgi:hypothetical protein
VTTPDTIIIELTTTAFGVLALLQIGQLVALFFAVARLVKPRCPTHPIFDFAMSTAELQQAIESTIRVLEKAPMSSDQAERALDVFLAVQRERAIYMAYPAATLKRREE